MREAIILALAHPDLRDEIDVYRSTLQFFIARRFGEAWRADFIGPYSRAFERAMAELRAEGIVGTSRADGFVLLLDGAST